MAAATNFAPVTSFDGFPAYMVPEQMKMEFAWLIDECLSNNWSLRHVTITETDPQDSESDPVYISIQGIIICNRRRFARFSIDSETAGHLAVHVTMHHLKGRSRFDNMYCVCDLMTGTCGFSLFELFQASTSDEADKTFGEQIVDHAQLRRTTIRLACVMSTHPRLGAESLFSRLAPELLRSIVLTVLFEL